MELISREKVRRLICENNDKYGYSDRFHEFTDEVLNNLPSAFKEMTNGEVMKAVFESDNVQFDETGSWIHIVLNGTDYSFCPVEFWNAPYKTESEDKAE